YTKATQTTVVTQNAYIVLATEDSTSNPVDSTELVADSASIDSLSAKSEPKRDSTFMTADTLFSQVIPLRDFIHLKLNLGKENDNLEEPDESPDLSADTTVRNNIVSRGPLIQTDSLTTAD